MPQIRLSDTLNLISNRAQSLGGGTFKSPGSTNHDIRADNLTGGLQVFSLLLAFS